jgi:hypothetical protein
MNEPPGHLIAPLLQPKIETRNADAIAKPQIKREVIR